MAAKKYRFACSGRNLTIVLRGSRHQPIRDARGDVLTMKLIPPITAVFENGYFETDNEDVVTLIKETVHWENDVYWHPTCLPKESPPERVAKSKKIADSQGHRAERRRRGQEEALNFPRG